METVERTQFACVLAAIALAACGPEGAGSGSPQAAATSAGAMAVPTGAQGLTSTTYGTGGSYKPMYVTNVTGGGAAPQTGYKLQGAKGNCAADDTQAFRDSAIAAANLGQSLVIPAPSGRCYKITGTITVTTSVIGRGYPLIEMSGAEGDGAHVMFRVNSRGLGIWITGLHLDGGWDGTTIYGSVPSQWSHGIDLYGSRNVTIQDNLIENVVGDDIYVGDDDGTKKTVTQAQNILINGNTLDNPFRCNVALINADGVVITNNWMRKKKSFVFGIDYEPNSGDVGVSNTEVAYNYVVAPTPPTYDPDPRVAENSNLQYASASCAHKGGKNNYLHHNYGDFAPSSDLSDRGGMGTDTRGRTVDGNLRAFWWSSDLYSCPNLWEIAVWANVPGSSPPSP